MKKVLISGFAGYIGSILSQMFLENNIEVIGIDNFSSNKSRDVNSQIKFYNCCISDENQMQKIYLENTDIDCVFHLASFSIVEESIEQKELYHLNNYEKSVIFFNTLIKNKISNFIFASTSAVYKENTLDTLSEESEIQINSPYAQSKLDIENFLKDKQKEDKNIRHITLRLFNVSGSYKGLGERHEPETHLIPSIIDAINHEQKVHIFGHKYNTNDGTAVRDYIHVADVAQSFINAGQKLVKREIQNMVFNIGSGKAYSNLEILHSIEKLTNKKVEYTISNEKRAGDKASLVANNNRAIKNHILELKNSSLEKIILDNIKFRKQLSN